MDSVLRSRIAAEIFPLAPWPCRGFPSLLSNVYIPRFLLDLSSAPLSFCGLARFVPLFAKRRCFRERRQRQIVSCLSADKSEDWHAKKTPNPVR